MTTANNSTSRPFKGSLAYRMIIGAMIGFMVISIFVFGVDYINPEWGKYWRIRPLIVTPLAGAMGGLCNYFIFQFHTRAGINKTEATIISALVFLVGLWMGVVAGLDGTMWD
jgi:drug/metabolite transporter (DMT)-like permease